MNRTFFKVIGTLLVTVGAGAQFKVETRLVEIYATVTDRSGRYVSGLKADRFQILEEGAQQQIVTFEPDGSAVSCALLLDTTGSMQAALPAVKNAIAAFADSLRPEDSAAVYSFSTSLTKLQDFTSEHTAVRRAVMRVRAAGATALFDSIAQLTHEISDRKGKKVLVVFTDGADNASALKGDAAIARAKKVGIPVYTVAEGDALKTRNLLNQLRTISTDTGGQFYEAKKTSDISEIFQDILANVEHSYLMSYTPPTSDRNTWRRIQVSVTELKSYRLRAKEGYFPE